MDNIDKHAQNVVRNITEGAQDNETNQENPVTPPTTEEPQLPEGWDESKVYLAKSEDGIDIPVPIGFSVSQIAGEKSVQNGLVIKQTETNNEFVWIPVENTSEMFGVDKNGNNLGKLYEFTSSGVKPLNWTENEEGIMSWTSSTGNREPDIVTYYDNTTSYYQIAGIKDKNGNQITTSAELKKQLQEEFKTMKESVEKYNGFYVGRYETGNLHEMNAVVAKGNADISGVNRSDSATNWYGQYQKNKTIAEGINVKSSMIWGCQWDAIMKWFLKDDRIKKYVIDSSGKGNYNSSGPIPTGSNDGYSVKNIYDMGGNAYDWTIEACGDGYRVTRGGAITRMSKEFPISKRDNTERSTDVYSGYLGSRAVLVM